MSTPEQTGEEGVDLFELLLALLARWKLLVFGPLLIAALAFGVALLLPSTYISRTVFLPPQQPQSSAASALAQLGSLSNLAGAATGVRNSGDQYVALLQTQTIADRIIDAFELMKVYDAEYRSAARKELASNVGVSFGRKDGLITVEVEDRDARRAADIANRYVEELRRLTADLALTEAQQRRLFLEGQLKQTRERLATAQVALQGSGFSVGALRSDARSAAEAYARLRAETTAAEIQLQALRSSLSDNTPEVQRAATALQGLRAQLSRAESGAQTEGGADYVSKYREFKYQETLFELYARQFEIARADESREGALIQVVDAALPAERKSRPRPAFIAALALLFGTAAMVLYVVLRHTMRVAADGADGATRMGRLRQALRGDAG